MDDSKFSSFMNEMMAIEKTKKFDPNSYDTIFGDRRNEIIALSTERNISRKAIYDSLVKAGIMSKDRSPEGFSQWMTTAIRKDREKIESEVEKVVSVNSAKISIKE